MIDERLITLEALTTSVDGLTLMTTEKSIA
jgi:hypothetical protein